MRRLRRGLWGYPVLIIRTLPHLLTTTTYLIYPFYWKILLNPLGSFWNGKEQMGLHASMSTQDIVVGYGVKTAIQNHEEGSFEYGLWHQIL